MKTIAFLIDNMNHVGGTERVTSIIANGLCHKYHTYIISAKGDASSFYPLEPEVHLVSMQAERKKNVLHRKLFIAQKTKEICQKKKVDVIIAVDIAYFIYLLPVLRDRNIHTIAWEHFNFNSPKKWLARVSRYLAVYLSNQVVVLGNQDLAVYKKHFPKAAANISCIYNPIHFPSKKIDSASAPKQVLAVGRLEPQKGFDLLLQIWEKIEQNTQDWKLVIVGEGSEKENLNNQIKQRHLRNIHIRPFTSQIDTYYLNSSIFCLSSRYEGFVLVLLEALSYGLPCISFDCKQGPREIIRDCINGYLIDCFDTEEFAAKLLKLMQNPQLRIQFSKNTAIDLEKYALKTILSNWIALIDSF